MCIFAAHFWTQYWIEAVQIAAFQKAASVPADQSILIHSWCPLITSFAGSTGVEGSSMAQLTVKSPRAIVKRAQVVTVKLAWWAVTRPSLYVSITVATDLCLVQPNSIGDNQPAVSSVQHEEGELGEPDTSLLN